MSIPTLESSQKLAPSRASVNEALAHARSLAPTVDAAYRAAQQRLSLAELERLYSRHSAEFSLPPQRLKSIVIEGLSAHWSKPIAKFLSAKLAPPSPPSLGSYISVATNWFKAIAHLLARQKHLDHGAEIQQHQQKIALLFEHLSDFDRAFTMRMGIARTPYSAENAFALARLLEKQLPYETFKTFLTHHFKEQSPEFLLAVARRNAFAERDAKNGEERNALLERIRSSAEREHGDIELQLACGFAELVSGNDAAARRQFTMAWVLNEQRRRAAIDDGGRIGSTPKQLDPWSLIYAFTFVSEGPQTRSYGIFRPVDATHVNVAAARALRAEGANLAALSFYGALMNTGSASRPPEKHIGYRNFWIVYFQDRWVAVPRSFVLSWFLPAALGTGMPAAGKRPPSKWKFIGKIKLWIGNRLASLIRFVRRLPGSTSALRLFSRFRNFVFQRFGASFGVVSASELSTLKQKIDVLSR